MNRPVYVAGTGMASQNTPWPDTLSTARRREFGTLGRLACIAATAALPDGLTQIHRESLGIAWGTSWGEQDSIVTCTQALTRRPIRLSPRRVPHIVFNSIPGCVSIALEASGPVWALPNGPASGAWALATALLHLQAGHAPDSWLIGVSDFAEGVVDSNDLSNASAVAVMVTRSVDDAHLGQITGVWPNAEDLAATETMWSNLPAWVHALHDAPGPESAASPGEGPVWQWRAAP